MPAVHLILIFVAGIAAGAINSLVGSGTLITFPTLLALGYPPVTANVSNNVGLIPGSISGVAGYRRELRGQGILLRRLAVSSLLGGMVGAAALLVAPAQAFRAIVPAFIAVALILILAQPLVTARWERQTTSGHVGSFVMFGVFLTGIYGGYFGAAQGIMLLAILAPRVGPSLQRANAVKLVLVGLVNVVAAIVFIAAAPVAWGAAVLIGAGALCGGYLGARYARRLPDSALRAVVVLVGSLALVKLLAA